MDLVVRPMNSVKNRRHQRLITSDLRSTDIVAVILLAPTRPARGDCLMGALFRLRATIS
jgi:hypothetical protein